MLCFLSAQKGYLYDFDELYCENDEKKVKAALTSMGFEKAAVTFIGKLLSLFLLHM